MESPGCPLADVVMGRAKNIMHAAEADEKAKNNRVLEEKAGLEKRPSKTMLNIPSPAPAASVTFASTREAKMEDPGASEPLRRGVGGGVDIEYPFGFETVLARTLGFPLDTDNGIGIIRAERPSAK